MGVVLEAVGAVYLGYTASRLWFLFCAPAETHIAKIGNSGSQSRLTRQTDRHV